MADVKRYVVSLPERAARATAAVAGGAIREVSDLLLPNAVRQSKLYQATVARLLRIVVELVGDVPDVYPPDLMPAKELAVRKTAGNVMELAGLAAVGWSPLWLLAAASDVLGGSKTFLQALVTSLEDERVLPLGTDIGSYDDLLTRLETASGTLADAIDVPPMNMADARASFDRLREQGRDLPSLDELGAIFAELQATARRERRSLAEVSAVIGIAAARTGLDLGNIHIFGYYRQAIAEIGREGLLVFLQRIVTPYIRRAGTHFRPSQPTYTDRMIDWVNHRRGSRDSPASAGQSGARSDAATAADEADELKPIP
ncbi:MAG: hypothetical protein M3464_18425 [Chloroflexota bacterium]|nr:hypothetical protein [Chloroflexota bacterium]